MAHYIDGFVLPIPRDRLGDYLKYRFGLFWKANIPLKQIVQAGKRTWHDEAQANDEISGHVS